jgi:ABC-type lipoprotein release transport system permease subunit
MFSQLKKSFKLSWRNIWRNRRRSLITMASVFFAVFFCVTMTCYTDGVWNKMIENTLRTQAGHLQIHGKGYWDDKVIDNFMSLDSANLSRLDRLQNIDNVSPRIETFAMASFETACKGIVLVGVSPERETLKSNLPVRLAEGKYLSETDDGVLIGEGLSRYLRANVGDTLALIGQGYRGVSAAQLFPVRGILRSPIDEMNSGMAYASLSALQRFIDMPDGYSGILVAVKDNDKLDETMRAVQQSVDTATLAVYPWQFTMERLLQTAESDKAFNKVVLFILYLIAGFGILGTVIMLTGERRREFAVMLSLGMQRRRLAAVVALELLMMTLCGVAAALLVTVPVAHFFARHPIELAGDMAKMYSDMGMEPVMPMATTPSIFAYQILVVALITALTAIYPMRKIFAMKIVIH